MTNVRRTFQSRNDAGFTLIELLISLSILALLLAMVPSTLRLGKRAWETPGQMNDNPATAALAFAGQHLKGALPIYQRDSIGLTRLAFSGTEQSVSFIAELVTGPLGGGLYRVDIGRDAGAAGLAVRLALYRPDAKPDSLASEVRDLTSAYSSLQFRYFGSPAAAAPPQWQPSWPRTDRLPDLIDIIATPSSGTTSPEFQMRAELKLRPML